VGRVDRREDLDQLGDDRAGEGAAGDDGRELPPEGAVSQARGSSGTTPRRWRPPETIDVSHTRRVSGASKFILSAFSYWLLASAFVDEIGQARRDHHHDAHREDPDEELNLYGRLLDGEEDERDQRDAVTP
jgi:hypothetical protein